MGRQRWRPSPRRQLVTQPAAGASWTQLNDSGGLWLVRGLVFVLATSAVVATRVPEVRAAAGTDVWFATPALTGQGASLTTRFSAFPGSPAAGTIGFTSTLPWPTDGLMLPPGHILSVVTTAIDAGDQYSAIFLDLVEYPETLPDNVAPSPFLYTDTDQE